MISFGNIAGLFALAALLVPLIIHLLSRKTRHSIPFGSLRFLESSETRTFKSLHLNEKLLLFLRVLLITFLVLILADLKWRNSSPEKQKLILVDPSYVDYTGIKEMLDTLADESTVKWADHDLTEISKTPNTRNSVFHAGFFNSLPETDSLVIISPALLAQFPGMPQGDVRVDRWLVLPDDALPNEMIISKGDSSMLITTETAKNALFTKHQKSDQKGEITIVPVTLDLPENSENQVDAAISALENSGWLSYSVGNQNDESKGEPIQLAAGNTFGDPIARISDKFLTIDSTLTNREAVALSYPLIMEEFLTRGVRSSIEDQITLPASQLPVRKTRNNGPLQQQKSSANYLIWIAVLVLIVERTISYRKTAR